MSKELMERIVIGVVYALQEGDPVVAIRIGERKLVVEWEPGQKKKPERDDPW